MTRSEVLALLVSVAGCGILTLKTQTRAAAAVTKIAKSRVLVFTTGPGYEGLVNQRLAECGKTPDFVADDLPWGERVDDTPIIHHNGNDYLQTILLEEDADYFMHGVPLDESLLPAFGVKQRRSYQGLPREKTVEVNTYNLSNILSITI